jgi:hypothetical protein
MRKDDEAEWWTMKGHQFWGRKPWPMSGTISAFIMSRDSSVGITTGYGLDDQGVRVQVPVGARIFTSPCRPDRLWGPPSLLSNGYRKRPGREADHSPLTSAEVKKMWIYAFTPPYAFMGQLRLMFISAFTKQTKTTKDRSLRSELGTSWTQTCSYHYTSLCNLHSATSRI